jgi:hypothetical protein
MVQCDLWVRSDPILLERILLNLVSNACATRIAAESRGARRRGGALRIEVRDSGSRYPQRSDRQRFSASSTSSPPGAGHRGGLGLGLAIVDRLCRLLDHPLELDPRAGRGSCFAVSLPPVSRANRWSLPSRPRHRRSGDRQADRGDRRRCAGSRRHARCAAKLGMLSSSPPNRTAPRSPVSTATTAGPT